MGYNGASGCSDCGQLYEHRGTCKFGTDEEVYDLQEEIRCVRAEREGAQHAAEVQRDHNLKLTEELKTLRKEIRKCLDKIYDCWQEHQYPELCTCINKADKKLEELIKDKDG